MAARISGPSALAALALAGLPFAAAAQTSTYYTPPKILAQGTAKSPIVGTGAVTVKVFVKKNASVGAVQVVKSTNHGDDAAALEIAKSSTYKAGLRDGRPEDAFYTLALKFNGSAVTTDTGSTSNDVNQANALIRAGKYDEAKSALQSYLVGHAGDRDAEALLGVADGFTNDNTGASAAFDAAGTIPDRFKSVAVKAYTEAAIEALKAKDNARSIALADKAMALQPSVNVLFVRGTAYANAQQYPQAIADLEKAKAQAAAGHADAGTLDLIDAGLATAYVYGGEADKGAALARDIKRRDPSNTRVDDTLAGYYNQQAVAAMKAGKKDEAVTDLESAAQALPSRSATLYVQAANILSQGDKPDWKRVKAEADKALTIAPDDAHANYVAAVALANQGQGKDAIPFLQKAKANAGSDAAFNADIDAALKKLGQK